MKTSVYPACCFVASTIPSGKKSDNLNSYDLVSIATEMQIIPKFLSIHLPNISVKFINEKFCQLLSSHHHNEEH